MSDSRENQLFEECARNIKENSRHSQVLFLFNHEEKPLSKARQIVEGLGVKVVNIEIFNFPKHSFTFALFKLDVNDMREVVLALLEHGYTPIKGYSAASVG